MRAFQVLVVLFCGLVAGQVNAQAVSPPFENLRVVDNPAFAGRPVDAVSLYTYCVRAEGRGTSQVVVDGNQVTLTVMMDAKVGEPCFATPPPPEDVDFKLGSFAPGTYTLVLQTISSQQGVTFLPLTTTFLVVPAPHHAVPATSLPLLLLLASGLALSAIWVTRKKVDAGARS